MARTTPQAVKSLNLVFSAPPENINTDPEQLRRKATLGTPSERSAFVKTITIQFPQFTHGIRLLEDSLNRSGSLDPGGVKILGASGLGKSFICSHFLRGHPTVINNDQVTIPILYLQLEASIPATELIKRLLKCIGFPFRTDFNLSGLTDLLVEGIQKRGTKLLLFDEAQEFAEGRGNSRAGLIGNTLKRIHDRTNVAQAFLGTELLERFFTIADQLSGRITAEHHLHPLLFDDTFRSVLHAFDTALPMPEKSDLAGALASPIHISTEGNMRLLRRLLSFAVEFAASENAKHLSQEHFSKAFYQVFGTRQNPFSNKQ